MRRREHPTALHPPTAAENIHSLPVDAPWVYVVHVHVRRGYAAVTM